MPIRALITAATQADCQHASTLMEGINAQGLVADKGYDSDTIVEEALRKNMRVVIPPRRHRRKQRAYDKERYKMRHLVENAFLHLKRWRGIATRYAKNTASFLADVNIRCLYLWWHKI